MNIRIGSRASRLALGQARQVLGQLKTAFPHETFELLPIRSEGDLITDQPLASLGGAGVFVKALQETLWRGEVDLLVHSCKDLPAEMPTASVIAAIPRRASPYDALIVAEGQNPVSLLDLAPQARVGTSSPRRKFQALAERSDLQLVELRGNVDTRLQKLNQGDYAAVIMAEAGLLRLGVSPPRVLLQGPAHIPAAAQGALAVECRHDDVAMRKMCQRLNDPESFDAVQAERAVLQRIKAGCHMPIGIYVSAHTGQFRMHVMLPRRPGFTGFYHVVEGADAMVLAVAMADKVLTEAGRILSKWQTSTL